MLKVQPDTKAQKKLGSVNLLSKREKFIVEKIADAAIIVIYGINTYLLKSHHVCEGFI